MNTHSFTHSLSHSLTYMLTRHVKQVLGSFCQKVVDFHKTKNNKKEEEEINNSLSILEKVTNRGKSIDVFNKHSRKIRRRVQSNNERLSGL